LSGPFEPALNFTTCARSHPIALLFNTPTVIATVGVFFFRTYLLTRPP